MTSRNNITRLSAAVALGLTAVAGGRALGADWPQWRGPERTALSKETGLLKSWPAEGPKLLWKTENLGEAHATPSVAKGRIYGMGVRGEDEVVWALDEKTGKELWATKVGGRIRLGAQQGGNGSRATPTVDGSRLYVIGVAGDLACLETAGGKLVWSKNLVKDFGGGVPPWGYSESALVDGDKVIATPGGGAATIVALNKNNGEVIWKSQVPEGNGVGYSSAIAADVDGQRQYIQFLAGGVVGVSAKDGKPLWRYTSPANRQGISCSTPIYRDKHVFAASAYGTGGGLAKISTSPEGQKAEEVYFTRQMKNHHGGMILVGDYLYGFDESNLTCIDFKTGEVKWADRSVGKGSLAYADGVLIARGERQGIALVEATPTAYVEKGRFDQPNRSGVPAWAHPVIANGKLYIRDDNTLLCYDITAR